MTEHKDEAMPLEQVRDDMLRVIASTNCSHHNDVCKWHQSLAAIAARDATAPDGTWLWGKFMDLCKRRGVAPATQNDLFAISEEAHKLNIAARDAKVEVTDEFAMNVAKAFQDSQQQVSVPRLGIRTMNWDDCSAQWHADHTRRMRAALGAALAKENGNG